MGLLDDLMKDLELWGAVQASRNKKGKPDPYKAAGIAAGMGNFSLDDQARLGAMLGSQGAFDDDDDSASDFDFDLDCPDTSYDETPTENDEDWQLTVEPNDFGISPFDYDTKEEYFEAIENANDKYTDEDNTVPPIEENPITVTVDCSVKMPVLDELEAIKESNFPNRRTYKAACEKFKLEKGLIIALDKDSKTQSINRCDFILKYHDKILAANYLSSQFGEFLYAQAVKEHFNLPFSLPEEDEESVTPIDDLFRQIYKNCKKQLFPIWQWCIDNFMPYMEYSNDNGYDLTTSIIANGDFIDDNFLNDLADFIKENNSFGIKLMELSPSLDNEYGTLFTLLLQKNQAELVEQMFKICAEKDIDSDNINGVICGFIEACSNYSELESMELFEQHIFPIIKAIDKTDIQDKISAWEDEIKDYYEYCEENCEQYQFTRKNAWRKQHKKEAESVGLDVLDYDTEEEYLEVYREEKYGWRDNYTTDDTYGLNPADFETEDALIKSIDKLIEQQDRQAEKEYKKAEKRISADNVQSNKRQNSLFKNSVKSISDNTIYNFIGVLFPYATQHYHYLTDDDTITIGDYVVVPVGIDNKETVGKVVSVEKHLGISVPFPVEKTKKVIRKYTETDAPLKKIRLISNYICYGPMPQADEEVEQHLTILSDGRVWLSRYAFGNGVEGKLKEKKQINVGKDVANDILQYTKRYFNKKGLTLRCTDVGDWELRMTDENDVKNIIQGSLISDDYTSEISAYFRKKLPFDYLFLFDGDV